MFLSCEAIALLPLYFDGQAVIFNMIDPTFASKCFPKIRRDADFSARRLAGWIRTRYWCGVSSSLWCWFFLLVFGCSLATAANRINVPVKINGQVMRFGFDTGAGAEVTLWQDVATLMALPSKSVTTGPLLPGRVAMGLSDPVVVEFFGSKSLEARIAVIQGPDYAKWEIQGLVGWPAVRNNIWKIDLGRSGLGIIGSIPAEAEGWLKYQVSQKKETLVLEIPKSDGGTGLLAIDTGSPGGVALSPRVWNEWKNAHPGPPAVLEGHEMLATGVALAEVTAAEQWSIDKLTLSNVLLEQAHPTEIAIHGDDYLATLGVDALRKLTLIIDGKNGWAYLQPHEDSARLGLYNRLGAAFVPVDPKGGELEARVAPESPAAMAGLRNGDRLLKLNGLDVEHWRKRPGCWPLAEFFNQRPGTRLDCVVKRDGQTVTVRPVLQEILNFKNVPPQPPFDVPPRPNFHFLPPLASLVRRARDLGIPIVPQSQAPEEGFMQKGDTVTALVTSVDEGKIQQWLVLFAGNDLKPQEKKADRKRPTLYTTSGREVRFDNTPAGVAIRTVGPFTVEGKKDSVRDEWSGAIVTRDYLALGFNSTALTMKKIALAKGTRIGFNTRPPATDKAAINRAQLESAGIGLEDERAFAGGTMAMADFFRIAAQTPGVRDVLREMLDISFKDLLKSPQININIQAEVEDDNPAFWGLAPGEPCRSFCFRIELNGVPRLACRVAATRPLRPLQTVAGVVGIAASRFDGSGPHVMVRMLSAHTGEAPITK